MVSDARRRLTMLGEAVGDQDLTPDALLVSAAALLSERCGGDAALAPREVEELSASWAALSRFEGEEATRALRFARGRLALCLGQREHGVEELSALAVDPPTEEQPQPRQIDVLRELVQYGVHLDADGAALPDARVARRTLYSERRRAEFWIAGGAALGGAHTQATTYSGAMVAESDQGPAWRATSGQGDAGLVTWREAVPTWGIAPELSFGLRGWTDHRPVGAPPLFGVGIYGAVRRETWQGTAWTGDPEIECSARDASGFCTQSSLSGFRLSSEPSVLLDGEGARLVVGPEFSWRLLPEREVSPAIHLVAPALDLPLGAPSEFCAEAVASGGIDNEPDTWEDVRTSVPTATGVSPLFSPNTATAGGWDRLGFDSQNDCHPVGPLTAFPTVRVGVSVSARPAPFLNLGARLDVEPLLVGDAITDDNPLPVDRHGTNLGPLTEALPPVVPILVVFSTLASLAF